MPKKRGSIITLKQLEAMIAAESARPKPTRGEVAARLYKAAQRKGKAAGKIDRMFRTK